MRHAFSIRTVESASKPHGCKPGSFGQLSNFIIHHINAIPNFYLIAWMPFRRIKRFCHNSHSVGRCCSSILHSRLQPYRVVHPLPPIRPVAFGLNDASSNRADSNLSWREAYRSYPQVVDGNHSDICSALYYHLSLIMISVLRIHTRPNLTTPCPTQPNRIILTIPNLTAPDHTKPYQTT